MATDTKAVMVTRPPVRSGQPRLSYILLSPATDHPTVLYGLILTILLLLGGGYALVHATGGTKLPHTFAMLIPVCVAASTFHLPGGVLVGVLAGLAVGPVMPLDVAAGAAQPTAGWIARLLWYVALGGFVGVLAGALHWRQALREHALKVDYLTGLPSPEALRLEDRPANGSLCALAIDFGLYDRLLESHDRARTVDVVRNLAVRLRAAVPADAMLTRLHSDMFGLLMPNDLTLISETLNSIRDQLPRWIEVGQHEQRIIVPVTAHVGVAEVDEADLAEFDVFRHSIRAARAARQTKRLLVHYDSVNEPVSREHLRISAELHQAIERNELFLAFQPKLRLIDGTVPAAEALIRWRHPERGLIRPDEFIPVAEQSPVINTLTLCVLAKAAQSLRTWRSRGRHLRLSLNVTGGNLTDKAVFDRLLGFVEVEGLEPGTISLEITETAFIDDLDAISERLTVLQRAGYDILVDDFGTGCSSFAYLHRLPVDGVKIDRTFVSTLLTDETAAELVQSMLEWCRRLGKRTIAEGVEDYETAVRLNALGCDEIQGYWLSKPLPSNRFIDWLECRSDTPFLQPDPARS